MRSLSVRLFFLIVGLFMISCAGTGGRGPLGDPRAPTPVFTAITKYERDDKARGPLGGDWKSGIGIFTAANGAIEAKTLIARGKSVVLLSQGASTKVIGLTEEAEAKKILQDRKVRKLGIPETGELLTGLDHRKYVEAATKFGEDFNQEMLKQLSIINP